jgi:uncharacterized protein with beta-barrel porin domain
MCGLLRPLGTLTTAVTRNVAIMLACAALLAGVTLSPAAHAQNGVGFLAPAAPTPTVLPSPVPTAINADVSAGSTILDLGSNYLERLGDQMTGGLNGAQRNPGGGGAPAAAELQRFRVWTEAYGITASTSAQGPFFGDQRKTWGGTAGFAATVLPGVNLGVSADQSHTSVDVPLALQSAGLDVTQFAFTASVDRGPWTWALALAHGNGNINAMRDTGLGFATAAYGAQTNGALTELSYFWALDQSRIVPKVALEYMRATTASFQEMGGLDPVSASGATL